ncbi:MAG: type II secretion system protein [Armatimonadota bacterium]|jgi:prepilin-type N-terminal cleavage/methylation domain-containing protein/prepilin-type processing-associated H-X9-DG protein
MLSRSPSTGFTLIELLVVIAIISILASIMMPVFSQARGKGRQAACISNVKQICLALQMYAQDYDENFPRGQAVAGDPDTQWYNAIFPYTRNRQILYCPDRSDRAPGYALNYLASGRSVNAFWDASSKIMIGDVRPEAIGAASPWHTGSDGNWHYNDIGNTICGAPSDNSFTGNNWPQRHNDGIILGFADGHVKWAREQQVDSPVYWDPALPTE